MMIPTSPLVQKGDSVSNYGWIVGLSLVVLAALFFVWRPLGIAAAFIVFAGIPLAVIGFSIRDSKFRRDLIKQAACGVVIILALVGLFALIN